MKIKIYTVGGTIDKIYFDQKSTYQVGQPKTRQILAEAHINFDYEITELMHMDSLDMTDAHRQLIFDAVQSDPHDLVVITHGTDTMVQTARKLGAILNKVIVLTGSMAPANFKSSDAAFNIGGAIAAVQTLPPGVYIAMNGRIFTPDNVRKNLDQNWFESLD